LESQTKPTSIFTYLLLVLCVATTAANAYLLHVNKALRASKVGRVVAVPVGQVVSSISGLGFGDTPVSLSTSGKKATVFMVYSPVCPFCEKNWPSWTGLISSNNSQDVNFVVADLTSTATPDFVSKKHSGRAMILHKLNPKDIVDLDLNIVPQTILIGSDSKVKKVWTGVLSVDDIASLNKLLL